jgi:hypothetical protein
LPLCPPLREPTTETLEIWLAGAPRKLICVCGEASGVPFSGEIVTADALAAPAPAAIVVASSTSAQIDRFRMRWVPSISLLARDYVDDAWRVLPGR